MGIGARSANESTGVAQRNCLCITGAALTFNFISLGFFQDLRQFNQSVDEEHRGEGSGIIVCYSNNTMALGTLHFLVSLLLQYQPLDASLAVNVEARQGLGVAVGLQTDGTLDLFLQQTQCLCESPAGEEKQQVQFKSLSPKKCMGVSCLSL